MKANIFAITLALTASAALSGCGDRFQEEYPWMVGEQSSQDKDNQENAGAEDITVLEKELRGAIPFMLNYSHEPTGSWAPHKYQYWRSNSIDNYAGYWTTSKGTFTFGGPLPSLYTPDNDYLGGACDNQMFTYSKDAIYYAEKLGKPAWRAVALIIQAYLGHEIVDFYGACPFNDYRANKLVPPLTWEAGADVYAQIFTELDEAVAILKREQPSASELEKIEDPTKTVSDGDWTRWVKLANSIKLRMAMNIVNVDPATAQQRAEEAVADEIGVLTDGDRDLGYASKDGHSTCIYQISVGWDDIRLGASLENILKHFNNPLINVWFDGFQYPISEKSTGIQAEKGIYGVRQGIAMINTTNKQNNYGPFGIMHENMRTAEQPFVKLAEVIFLRAEGALRGWAMGGTAQEWYEKGIRLMFDENRQYTDLNLDADAYLAQDVCDVVDYVDPLNFSHNIDGRVAVGVKWNEADDNETKLEKIISQKYIANFPMGAEAWTTFRRTGYPRLFPVYLNPMYPDVDYELQIRRIPLKVTTNNALEMSQLEQVLGGPQNGGTRVFWDNSDTWTRGEPKDNPSAIVVAPNNF